MHTDNDRHRYVHYGSHTTGPETWLNFDSSPTLRLQRLRFVGGAIRRNLREGRPRFPETVLYGDIVRGLPVEEGQCRAIYCSHVLEHLSLEDCKQALRNTYKYLEPGGIFRLVMPDLRALTEAYLAHPATDAAHLFMERAWLGKKTRPQSLAQKLISSTGNADHLWMWDYASMSAELDAVGFTNIRRARFGDSKEPRFADVESRDRWEEPGFTGGGGGANPVPGNRVYEASVSHD